jgi:putative transposase
VIPFFAFQRPSGGSSTPPTPLRRSTQNYAAAVRTRGHFPTDDAATKLLFLVLREAAGEWKIPAREWFEAKTQFAIMFDERFVQA